MSASNDSKSRQDFDYDKDCIVCMEPLPASGTNGDRHVVKCTNGHHFCSSCIDTWAEENKGQRKCPICRVARVSMGTNLTSDQIQRIRNKLQKSFKIESLDDVEIFMRFIQEKILPQFFLPSYASDISCIFYTNMILKKLDAPELPVPDPKDNPAANSINFEELLCIKVEKLLRKIIEPCFQ